MRDEVRVAVAQIDIAWFDPAANLRKAREFMQRAADEGWVDIILFPELANSGYVTGRQGDFGREYLKLAEKLDGPFLHSLGQSAREHHMFAVTGLLEAHPTIPATAYNSSVLLSPEGEVIGLHHKMHIPGEERHYFYAGNTVTVVATELASIGLCVCADRRFPELIRMLALKGAEIVCSVANIPGAERMRRDPQRAYAIPRCRALENELFYAESNRVGKQEELEFCGRSAIAGPSGELLAWSETEAEELVRATLRGVDILAERAYQPNFRDRRPERYGLLTELA